MNPLAVKKTNSPQFRTLKEIMADASKDVPTRIELLKAGTWPSSSVKGPLTITAADLQEMKRNFDAGVGIPAGLSKMPIDFSHEDWGPAAGWISALDIVGDTLYADVEWSTSGLTALQGGEYKCISPSFWPGCRGEWQDPENADITARNVLTGAGLTNIPFFKDLTPIMASTASSNDAGRSDKNVIYIASEKESTTVPTLDEVRIKDVADLSDDDKQVLADHKAELSQEELEKFGLTEAAQKPTETNKEENTEMTEEVKEAVALQASVKAGEKVVMAAADVKAMQDQIKAHASQLDTYRKAAVEASVKKHIARGAIKADQFEKWTNRIMADATVEDLLNDLPDNKILASEQGTPEAANVADAAKAFEDRVQEIIKASNGTINYGQAVVKAAQENPQLANDRQAQLTNNK